MEIPEQDIMDAYSVVFDGLAYLGPGDEVTSRILLQQLRFGLQPATRVADFGCGNGASALMLARNLPAARVMALDLHAPFIEQLQASASDLGLEERICAVVGDMSSPPPLDGVKGEFDLIWSESAIYSIGRSAAFESWRSLLATDGRLVFSDVVWQREPGDRSELATRFWVNEYPDISTPNAIQDELAAAGYSPVERLLAGRKPWSNYYEPLRQRLRRLQERGGHSVALSELLSEIEREIEVYDNAGDEVALCYFVASPG